MNLADVIRQYATDNELQLVLYDGFEAAIIGVVTRFGESGPEEFVLYDRKKCIQVLVDGGMDPDEAEEYFEFNTAGFYAGETTPGFLQRVEDMPEVEDVPEGE